MAREFPGRAEIRRCRLLCRPRRISKAKHRGIRGDPAYRTVDPCDLFKHLDSRRGRHLHATERTGHPGTEDAGLHHGRHRCLWQVPFGVGQRGVFPEHWFEALSRLLSSPLYDIDRWDYLLRDAHATGVRYGIYDLGWMIHSLTLSRNSVKSTIFLMVSWSHKRRFASGYRKTSCYGECR